VNDKWVVFVAQVEVHLLDNHVLAPAFHQPIHELDIKSTRHTSPGADSDLGYVLGISRPRMVFGQGLPVTQTTGQLSNPSPMHTTSKRIKIPPNAFAGTTKQTQRPNVIDAGANEMERVSTRKDHGNVCGISNPCCFIGIFKN
jgi:hypothetical protein